MSNTLGYKDFYKDYHNGHVIYGCNKEIIKRVNNYNPEYVLEFGCGSGKNLNLIDARVRVGIDLSMVAVIDGQRNYEGIDLRVGDESWLERCVDHYDVVFTVSVLNHIPEIDRIVHNLKRVADRVLVMESCDKWHKHCYRHNYEKWFSNSGYSWVSPFTKAEYRLYIS